MKIRITTGRYGFAYWCTLCGCYIPDFKLQGSDKILVHPTTERHGFLWLLERPVNCPNAGKKCKCPDIQEMQDL